MAGIPITVTDSAEFLKCSAEGNVKEDKKPTCIIVLKMTGSGKTTLVTKLVSTLY